MLKECPSLKKYGSCKACIDHETKIAIKRLAREMSDLIDKDILNEIRQKA